MFYDRLSYFVNARVMNVADEELKCKRRHWSILGSMQNSLGLEHMTMELNEKLFDEDWMIVNEALNLVSNGMKVSEEQLKRIVCLVQFQETCRCALRALIATNYDDFDMMETGLLDIIRRWICAMDSDLARDCLVGLGFLCGNSSSIRNSVLYSGILIDIGNCEVDCDVLFEFYESMFIQTPFPVGLEATVLPYMFRLPHYNPRILNLLCYLLEGTSCVNTSSAIVQEQFLSILANHVHNPIDPDIVGKSIHILTRICNPDIISEFARLNIPSSVHEILLNGPLTDNILIASANFIRIVVSFGYSDLFHDVLDIFMDETQPFSVKEAGLFAIEQILTFSTPEFVTRTASTSPLFQYLQDMKNSSVPGIDNSISVIIDILSNATNQDQLALLKDMV